MNLEKFSRELLNAFAEYESNPALSEQIAHSSIDQIATNEDGYFAEIHTTSSAGPVLGISDASQSLLAVISNSGEIGDAILHFRLGKISQLEINLYQRKNWDLLVGAKLSY
jgi:hypothetical protein